MVIFIVILFFLAIIAAVTVPIAVMYSRRQAREQKNYERGLKMIPMLIHLPPISEDMDGGGRDQRDLAEENISKAQVIYNIIAGTYEKGFKRKLYGQQHFSFEILSAQGFVYFYTTVPIGLVEVVKQAIVSAYPSARLEEAEEHNIFSSVGKASATSGGELVLRESFVYPIATYLDLKRDTMAGILNALSTLGKEDGAAIQILMRPTDPAWRRKSHEFASNKRKGDDSSSGSKAFGVAKDFASAFYKAPEEKKDGGSDKPELSSLDQAVLDSIDDKTRYPAYEVLIRVVASSNVTSRAQSIVTAILNGFEQFNAQGKNGFKYVPATDIDELVTSYILKFFPQRNKQMILNSVELATLFHFPDQRSIPTSQLERQDSKQVDGPRNMPDEGLLLGYNVFRGVKKPIRLAIGDRQRHMYVVGQTGTGKSTFLENLALQDMMDGNGFAFVDPHGDTAEKLLSMVPKERSEDIIYFSPADMDYPMGLNLFEFENPDQKDFLIQEALNMLKKLYDPNNQGIMGPRYEHLFRNAALTVMADPEGGTFIDIPKLFRDPQYVKQKLQYIKDPNVLEFWQKEMPQSQRSNEFGEVVSWFVSKFGAFLSNEMMRNIIGQTKSAFNLRDIMDNKKILLVNLSKGRTGDLNSKLLGMVFVMQFQAAAMSRANIPEKDRVDFSLYVDEFQNFSTDSFATIMSEARKYRLNLIVANQFTTQLSEEIRDAVFGNMGTIVAYRIGQNDVESLSRYFQPTFDGDDLLRVPNYNAIVRTLVGGVPTQPFSMTALPPLGEPNVKLSAALKQLSAAKFGRPKAVVEKEIFERIATKNDAAVPGAPGGSSAAAQRPFAPGNAGMTPSGGSPWGRQPSAFGQPAAPAPSAAPAAFGQAPTAPAGRTGTGSFLDEWLTKRGAPAGPAPVAAQPAPVAPSQPVSQTMSSFQNSAQTIQPQPTQNAQLAPLPDQGVQPVEPIDVKPAPAQPIDDTQAVVSMPESEITSASSIDDEVFDDGGLPTAPHHEDDTSDADHAPRKKRRKRRKNRNGTDGSTDEDQSANDGQGVMEIGNTYDRNQLPGNHVVTASSHLDEGQPKPVPAADYEPVKPYEKPTGVAEHEGHVDRHYMQPQGQSGMLSSSANPTKPTANQADLDPDDQPAGQAKDQYMRFEEAPVPQAAHTVQPVEMPVEPVPDYANKASEEAVSEASTEPEQPQSKPVKQDSEEEDKDPDLSLLEASRRQREQAAGEDEQHLSHGDTIYIDQDGHLKEVKEENVGRGNG